MAFYDDENSSYSETGNMLIGLISSYFGDDVESGTWDGDSNVDGWLGLAPSSYTYNML